MAQMTAFDHVKRPNAVTKFVMRQTVSKFTADRWEAKAAVQLLIDQGAVTDKPTLEKMRGEAADGASVVAFSDECAKKAAQYAIGALPWAAIIQALLAALAGCGL